MFMYTIFMIILIYFIKLTKSAIMIKSFFELTFFYLTHINESPSILSSMLMFCFNDIIKNIKLT